MLMKGLASAPDIEPFLVMQYYCPKLSLFDESQWEVGNSIS